jgi:hypothetical protein
LLLESHKIILKESPVFKDNFSPKALQEMIGLIKERKCRPGE